jgi:ABC-type transport system substrate-binding protein
MKKLFPIWAIVILSMALILVGTMQTPAAAPQPTPKYGGILKMIWSSGPTVLGDPTEMSSLTYIHALGCLESLLDFDPSMRFQPTALSTALAVAPGGKSIKITLRKGVKFHDGTDFNAQAAKWNLDRVMKGKVLGTETWASIDVLDDYTVSINLKQYDITFLTQLGRGLGFQISPTAFEKNGLEWAKFHPIGTGPFKFKSFERDVSLKYERFDGYWQKGLPYLDGLEYAFLKDPMVQVAAFRAGEAQVLYWAKGKQASDLKALGYEVISKMTSMSAILPDSANPDSALSNKKVREALEYATNRKAIAELGYGFWRGADQPCIPEFPLGYNPAIKPREYNPAKAKQLLAEAGYPNGFKTRIITDQGLGVMDPMVAIQEQWKAVGVDVTLENVPRAKYEEYRTKGWYNGFVHSGMGLDPVYLNTLDRFLSNTGRVYVSTLRPPRWEKAFSDARAAADHDAMAKLTQEMVKTAYDEAAFLPLWAYTDPFVLDKSVRDTGFLTSRYFWHLWTPEKAWLSK